MGLGAGDRILLFTDGISEAESSTKEFGVDRLCDLLRAMPGENADAILRCVMHSVTQFCANDFRDDVTILVFVVESDGRPDATCDGDANSAFME
jgi:phosphoserine phosphatase RsbU/P